MKLTLLLCALLFSAQAWCSSGPVYSAARAVPVSPRVVSVSLESPQAGEMNMALIMCGAICYMVSILWWAHSAKRRLDKTLAGVVESMTEY